ncbi:MAG: hypothetical protein NVS4B2_27190 [Chloroflexota bacterium]
MVVTLVWIRIFLLVAHLKGGPQADPFGVDFAHNMSSAYVMDHGGNPYDSKVLIPGEHAYFRTHRVVDRPGTARPAYVWGGYPPLYFWALRPLTTFSFPVIATAWIFATFAMMAAGFLLCLSYFGWTRRLVPALLFMAMPQTTFQAYYANPAGMVFGLVLVALTVHKRWPLGAGLLLSLTWLKPQLGLPSFLLIALFYPPGRVRVVIGFILGTLVLVGLTLVGPGVSSLLAWLHGIQSVSGLAGEQPNMIPLVGLYAGWASPALHSVVEYLALAVAVCLTGWWWRRLRHLPDVPFHLVAWLWPVWLLALPYAHFPDEILLAPAILAVLGPNGRDLGKLTPALCLYLLYGSTLLYNLEVQHIQFLWLPLLGITIALYRYALQPLRTSGGAPIGNTALMWRQYAV